MKYKFILKKIGRGMVMTYCRYCGCELSYKRTKNNKWIPCDSATGEPHFCNKIKQSRNNQKIKAKNKSLIMKNTGIAPCKICGKPCFLSNSGTKQIIIDYTTLQLHICKKADITRYAKYNKKRSVINE